MTTVFGNPYGTAALNLEPTTGIRQVTTTPEPESNVTSDDGNVSDVSTTTTSTPYLGLTDSELVPLID